MGWVAFADEHISAEEREEIEAIALEFEFPGGDGEMVAASGQTENEDITPPCRSE